MDTQFHTEQATPEEKQAVKMIVLATHPRGKTVVTGVVLFEGVYYLQVRLYSAGCLHGVQWVPKGKVLEVVATPR